MSGNAIAEVGNTLIQLLKDNLGIDANSIVLHSPAELANSTRLTLFLYNVLENPYMRNQSAIVTQGGSLQFPPLVVDLHYMLTAYSPNPVLTDKTLEEHQILGKAMQVLYDHGSIPLPGRLEGDEQELRIALNPVTVSELSDIWTAFTSLAVGALLCGINRE